RVKTEHQDCHRNPSISNTRASLTTKSKLLAIISSRTTPSNRKKRAKPENTQQATVSDHPWTPIAPPPTLATSSLSRRPFRSPKIAPSQNPIRHQSLRLVFKMAQVGQQNGSLEVKEPSAKIPKLHQNGVEHDNTSSLLRVKKLSEKAVLPKRGSPLAAGYDLSRRLKQSSMMFKDYL
ncbi:hypothetical protein CUMW_159930, partial [Citrus unshiu]